jgi:hypothetical protein
MRYEQGEVLPHEFHITIETVEGDALEQFKFLCRELKGKAMDIRGIDREGKEVQRDIMYSSDAKHTHEEAHEVVVNLAAKIHAGGFRVTRLKVETVPVCEITSKLEIMDLPTQLLKRNAPSHTLPYGRYFEAHFAVTLPDFPTLAHAGCKVVFSYDALREKRKWIATIRNYSCGPLAFRDQVSRALTHLSWSGWGVPTSVDEVDLEYAILDTAQDLDAAWIGERR